MSLTGKLIFPFPTPGSETQQTSRALNQQHAECHCLHAKYIFFVVKGELCLMTEASAASVRCRTGCVITCLMSDALQGYRFIFLHHLSFSHTLPSNVFYSRHKCWNGRRGEGRRVGGGAERDRDSRGLVSHRAASV